MDLDSLLVLLRRTDLQQCRLRPERRGGRRFLQSVGAVGGGTQGLRQIPFSLVGA